MFTFNTQNYHTRLGLDELASRLDSFLLPTSFGITAVRNSVADWALSPSIGGSFFGLPRISLLDD
jgi:hypothetical protein